MATINELAEIIDTIETLLDDAGAVGCSDDAMDISGALILLGSAAHYRGRAIIARLSGNIDRAQLGEALSDKCIGEARAQLPEED